MLKNINNYLGKTDLCNLGKRGFTLVEIVVVILIMGIILSIATISMVKWFGQSRDVKRKSDINTIASALDSYQIKNDIYPTPDDSINIDYSGTNIIIQGVIGQSVQKKLGIKTSLKDPTDGLLYFYSTNSYKSKYELGCLLETAAGDQIKIANSDKAIAQDYSKRYTYAQGDGVGIFLLSGSKSPIHLSQLSIDLKTFAGVLYLIFPNDQKILGNSNSLLFGLATYTSDFARFDGFLKGYWPFEETYGEITYDKSSSFNTGTIAGNIEWTEGKRSSSIIFDGIDDYISVPDKDSLDIQDAMTLSVWVNVTDYPSSGYAGIAGKVNTDETSGNYSLALSSDGKVNGFINGTSNGVSYNVGLNKWHHLALTYDKTNIVLYIDGVQVATKSYNQPIGISTNPFNIGKSNGFFKGIIDEVRLYSRALTDAEIQMIYSAN